MARLLLRDLPLERLEPVPRPGGEPGVALVVPHLDRDRCRVPDVAQEAEDLAEGHGALPEGDATELTGASVLELDRVDVRQGRRELLHDGQSVPGEVADVEVEADALHLPED